MQILVVTKKSQRATSAVTPLRAQGGNPQEVSEVKTNSMQEPRSLQTLAVDSAALQATPDHQYEIAFILL